MPYYCTVPRCTSMAGKAKNVSFHQFPRDEELAKLWNKILKRGKPYTKYSKVCSLHFKPEDYTITSVGKNKGQWRTLRKDAIPSQNLPSESPTPYQRKQWGSWSANAPANVLDPTIHQTVAQAIYMQTMLAMQAAGTTDVSMNHSNSLPQLATNVPLAHTSHTPDADILKGKQTNTESEEKNTSYKCADCSKCFKDPDVFILHKRSHKSDKPEKENFNLNMTLQSNPILANLLKTNPENPNIFDSNVLSVENLLMTALAANMEGYIRNFSSMIKNGDRGSTNSDRNDSDHDRSESNHDNVNFHVRDEANGFRVVLSHDSSDFNVKGDSDHLRGSSNHARSNSSNDRNSLDNRVCNDQFDQDADLSQRGTLNHDNNREECLDQVRGDFNHDRGFSNHDSKSNCDRTTHYNANDAYDRNVRYFENDSDNDRDYHSDRGVMNDDGGIMDDDEYQGSGEPICDSDLNESIDSMKLVIDEST